MPVTVDNFVRAESDLYSGAIAHQTVIRLNRDRFLLNKQSGLELNADGSLTLAFAPKKPLGLPEPNWLPTPEGQPYNLTYRFYGPSQDIVSSAWFPPPLIEQE